MSGFTEAWFDDASQQALADLVVDVRDVPGIVLEIGAWQGRSTVVLANATDDRTVHTVDPWDGRGSDVSLEIAAVRDIFTEWSENVKAFTSGNVVGHRMGWRDFVPTVTEPVALCFIDGEHSYTEVADNITAVLPLLAPGGVICGDDVHNVEVQNAVVDTLGGVDVVASMWVWPQGSLTARFDHAVRTPSDINEHLLWFVDCVRMLNAEHVIELGSRSGVSTLAWLYALRANGGRLTTVDLDIAPQIGTWPNWEHIQGNDEDPDVLAQLVPADIVFLDTSHLYAETCRELNLYRWLVKPGGVLICHDSAVERFFEAPDSEPPFSVRKAIAEFIDDTGFDMFEFGHCNGLTVIKVV